MRAYNSHIKTKGDPVILRSTLSIYVIVLYLFSSNFNTLLISLFSEEGARYVSQRISIEFLGGVVLILYVMLLTPKTIPRVSGASLLQNISILGFALIATFNSVYVHDSYRPAITLLSMPVVFYSGYLLFARYALEISIGLSKWIGWFFVLTVIILLLFFLTDRLMLEASGYFKPQISGGIRSTEISIIVALQSVYILYALDCMRALNYRNKRRLLFVVLMLNVLTHIWLASVAGLIAIAIVMAGYLFLYEKKVYSILVLAMIPVLMAAFLSVAVLLGYDDLLLSLFSTKYHDIAAGGIRYQVNTMLIDLTMENISSGVGIGKFPELNSIGWQGQGVYPHNNILGISAELGLASGIFYTLFLIATLWIAMSVVSHSRLAGIGHSERRVLKSTGMLALFCFFILQFKGLIQDTWQLKETYFWAGAIFGLYTYQTRCQVFGRESLRPCSLRQYK